MDKGVKCSRCGTRDADKYSSGVAECWRCWYRRKMDLPAARYWADRTPKFTEAADEWTAQFDMWDWMHFLPACGLSQDEIKDMIEGLDKVKEYAERVRAYSQLMVETGYGDMPNEDELSKKRDKEGEGE